MPQHRRLKIAGGSPGEVASYLDNETTTDPGASNDSTQGYAVGSVWINTTDDRAWICVDATASAAVWVDGVPREEWAQNGFETRDTSTLTFTDGTRTLSIQPTVTSFDYWVEGKKYTTTGDTRQITDVDGIHVVYYDGATLTSIANPTTAQVDSIIRTKCIVSIIYWNTTDLNEGIYVGDERHGRSMAPDTHAYLHFVNGLAYLSGLALNTISTEQSGDLDSHAQFGVDAGAVTDEDLYFAISAVTSTTGLPIYYMLGAGPRWYRHTKSGFSVRTLDDTTATRLAYNQFTGGAWQLTQVTSGNYVLCHVFATTEKDAPMIAIVGQAEYANIAAARAGADTEIRSLVLDDILFPEARPIATLIFQTNLSYANAVNARIRSTSDGGDYVDWRDETISRTVVGTDDHNSLTGKQGGTTDEYYHLTQTQHDNLVTAAATIDDDKVVRGDGGARGVQKTGVGIDDSNNVSGVANLNLTGTLHGRTLTVRNISQAGNPISNYDVVLATTDLLKNSAAATTSWGGFVAPASGENNDFIYHNAHAADDHSFLHENGSSTAGNRINTPNGATWTLGPGGSVRVYYDNASSRWRLDADAAGTGSGDVTGPGSSTDHAVARFDGTGGKTIQNSVLIVSDTGDISGVANASIAGYLRGRSYTNRSVGSGGTFNDYDWLPASTDTFRQTGTSSAVTFTGLLAPTSGQNYEFVYVIVGDKNTTFSNESGSSTAANRIATHTGSDFTLTPGQACMLRYDTDSSRWRIIAVADAGGGGIGGSTGSTDNAVLRADGTGGSTAQASGVLIDDSDNMTLPGGLRQWPVTRISPTALAAQANNYDPTDLGTCDLLRQDLTGTQTITGFAAPSGADNHRFVIKNIAAAAEALILAHESSSSTAANRIVTQSGNDLTLTTGESATLYYDDTATRWIVVGLSKHQPDVYDNGNSGAAITIDWRRGRMQKVVLTANCTFTWTAPTEPGMYALRIAQDATGGRSLTWPSAAKWPNSFSATHPPGASKYCWWIGTWDGTNYDGDLYGGLGGFG